MSPDSAWNTLQVYASDIPSWTEATFLLPNPSATYQLAFQASDHYGYGVGLDNLYIGEAPTCLAPTDVNVLAVTASSITIDWTDQTTAPDGYVVEYAPAGAPAAQLQQMAFAAHPATITGLDTLVQYQIFVRAVCVAGQDTSMRSPAITAATNRCDET